ncbi:MAG: hypothetical protein WAU78_04165 [Roseiarcus sp.]
MRAITFCHAPEREAFNQFQQPPANRSEGPSRPKTHEISLPSSQDRPLTLIKLSFSYGGHVWTATRNFQQCEVVPLCGATSPRPAASLALRAVDVALPPAVRQLADA